MVAQAQVETHDSGQLRQALENQRVLTGLVQLSLADDPLPELIEQALHLILTVSWLRTPRKGVIFLSEPNSGILVPAASSDMAPQLKTHCARVPFGHCLCGITAQQKRLQFSSGDQQYDTSFECMSPCSYHSVPILDKEETVLGVFTVHLEYGHQKSELEIDFLTAVADILAALIKKKRTDEKLEWVARELEYQKKALDEHALVAITDTSGKILYVNDTFCETSQYSREELLGENHRLLNSGLHPKSFFADMYKTITQGKTWKGEVRNKRKDGSYYWLAATIVPSQDSEGRNIHYTAVRTDITLRKESEAKLRASNLLHKKRVAELETLKLELERKTDQAVKDARALRKSKEEQSRTHEYLLTSINSMRHGFVIWSADDRLVLANDAYREFHHPLASRIVAGIEFSEMLALGFDANIWDTRGENRQEWLEKQLSAWRSEPEYSKEMVLSDGRILVYEGQVLKNGEVLTALTDVTSQRQREQQLQNAKNKVETIAYYDILTGLPNRAHCQRDLMERFALDKEKNRFAFVQIDLDKFKRVNDTLGHAAGDALLKALGSRLELLGEEFPDFKCYRWGGDEFIALIGCDDKTDLEAICQEITDLISIPHQYKTTTLRPSVSLGIARYPEDATDLDALMVFADLALYRTKELGRDGYHFFTPDMKEAVDAEVQMERDIRIALEEDQFELYFQPQVDLESEAVTGLEALVRWDHPQHGVMLPGDFLPVVESSGLAATLGRKVFSKAMSAITSWREEGLEFGRLAINLSPEHLKQGAVLDDIVSAMDEYGVDPNFVAVEILESYLLDDPNADVSETLKKLVNLGVYVELDDFGTGYASLSHLSSLPISGLKVDRTFIHNVDQGPQKRAIVTALISLAKLMKMRVVCEGLETRAQLDAVVNIGNCSVQGFFIAKPMSFKATTSWIKNRRNLNLLNPDTAQSDPKHRSKAG